MTGLLLCVGTRGYAGGPLSPRAEQATFRVAKGFRIELVASEPEVIDPVAMAFDERGRLFVAEMRGYPNGGVATGRENRGRIRCLIDEDGDGVFEKSTVFADGLRFPTGVMPWKGGLIVANAPDLIYLEDTDGDNKADRSRVLYTGFNLDNIQQLVNSLQWGLDNWVYASAGSNGGDVRSAEKPDAPAVALRGRGLRFQPGVPASLEPTSGGGQYGLAPDRWEHWFTATNSQHLRQIVLPDRYLRRNPFLSVPAVSADIPDHGAACQVHRISPFEGWRVERTGRRKGGPDAARFPATELVPGGFITSACSPIVYEAGLFPPEYHGNTFVCDPANNLIHRDLLSPRAGAFIARRADTDSEFLASTDNWFRPVHLTIGPEGAVYLLDFYREVIETPLSLPEDIKRRLNLESRARGRIWRVVPERFKQPAPITLHRASADELTRALEDDNLWTRLTAQRLLVERADHRSIGAIRKLTDGSPTPLGRIHALWTLHGLRALDAGRVVTALQDREAGVREQATILSEPFVADNAVLAKEVLARLDDPSEMVRFQLALSLGALPVDQAGPALARLLKRDGANVWVQSAALSSALQSAPAILEGLAVDRDYLTGPTAGSTVMRLAAIVGSSADERLVARSLRLLPGLHAAAPPAALALLEGLGQGLQNTARPLSQMWDRPAESIAPAMKEAARFFKTAAETARDAQRPPAERLAAARLLAHGPSSVCLPACRELLTAQTPVELQVAGARALSVRGEKEIGGLLLAGWAGYGPELRRAVLEAVFARADRVAALLDAVDNKQVQIGQLGPERLAQLRQLGNQALRQKAQRLLIGAVGADRQRAVEAYRSALDLEGDARRGKDVFAKNCAACHRLGEQGHDVGANLMAALRTKTREALLVDILDPSREVDPRFVNYIVTTQNGRSVTGILAVETPSSITLRRAERQEDTILRSQIESIQATAKSLMPDEFEKQISRQELADLVEFLLGVVK